MQSRRDFLKQSGLLGAAALSPILLATLQAEEQGSTASAGNKSFTIPMHEEIRIIPPRRKITIPDVGEFKVLKGDFHIHTIFSDGSVWPENRITEAAGNGLDIIAITDHIEYRPHIGGNGIKLRDLNDEHNLAYNRAKPVADRENILLVRGTEITKFQMPPGHFNALFVEDVNPIAAAVEDVWKMFEETKNQGGFLLWNHPGWASTSGGLPKGEPITFFPMHEEFFKKGFMDGIETFNGTEFYPIVSDWVEEKELAIFANSDIHKSEFDTYGVRNTRRPITLVLAKERTLESAKEAFFAKRTVAWFNHRIAGRAKIVRDLFDACIGMKKEGNRVLFTNKSDIPVEVQAGSEGEKTVLVPAMGSAPVEQTSDSFTISNWWVGRDKPLRVEFS